MKVFQRKSNVAKLIACAIGLCPSVWARAASHSIESDPGSAQMAHVDDQNQTPSSWFLIASCDSSCLEDFVGKRASQGGNDSAGERRLGTKNRTHGGDRPASDRWEFFPTQIGRNRASISFNKSYANIANQDPRATLYRFRIKFEHPTAEGFPSSEEFPEINDAEDLITNAVVALGGVEVGRVTANGHRDFFFYGAFKDESAKEIAASVETKTTYQPEVTLQTDPEKAGYWKFLYPTEDDWQVISDMRVLDALQKQGDNPARTRHVSHWASFASRRVAQRFSDWARANLYSNVSMVSTEDGTRLVVHFAHEGTMELADITHHTITINREVKALGGHYDGWETIVLRDR
ncbi:DUF695 domain-containing protein [Paraburkholderia sediminicola]|uniref:DUF695 domain-containing protein n=1 Tax=Paraburkholderia TaxID=1822464 RepID=UPI0038B8452E